MNIDALRRDFTAKQDAAQTLYASMAATAEHDGRVFTDEEKTAIEKAYTEAKDLQAQINRAESDASIGRAITSLVPNGPRDLALPMRPVASAPGRLSLLSLGEQFVGHENYTFFRNGQHKRQSAWTSPSFELAYIGSSGLYAATLTEDPASGGKLVAPDVRPGIQPLLFRRTVVADLIAPGTTDSNLVQYMVEKSFVNAADTVAEGAAKPESTLTFDAASDPVRKIAHWLPTTEEMLEDVAQIRSYIDARLTLGVQLAEEGINFLNGTVTAPDIIGIRNRTGLAPDVPMGVDDTVADAIFKQMMAIYGTSYLMPDGIVMNPADWQGVQLMKDDAGNYVGSGPFAGPQAAVLWGLPVAVTPAIEAGVALVGAFRQAAQVFRKGGLRIEASNSHQDFFVKNLVAIRAEERLALAVYRPAAFGEVTGLAAVAGAARSRRE